MKKLLILAAIVAAGYFAWKRLGAPSEFPGKELPEDARVSYISGSAGTNRTDALTNGEWTLLLFTTPESSEAADVERRIELALRKRVKTVHLVVIDVGSLNSPGAAGLKLTRIPTAELYDGVGLKSSDLAEILRMLGA